MSGTASNKMLLITDDPRPAFPVTAYRQSRANRCDCQLLPYAISFFSPSLMSYPWESCYGSSSLFSGSAMVLILPCDDGGPRVELALLLIDLLPPEAREALPWRPQHTWEEAGGGRGGGERVHPHLAMQPRHHLTHLTHYSPPLLLLILLAPPSKLPFSGPPCSCYYCPLDSLRPNLISTPWEVAAEEQEPEFGKEQTPLFLFI